MVVRVLYLLALVASEVLQLEACAAALKQLHQSQLHLVLVVPGLIERMNENTEEDTCVRGLLKCVVCTATTAPK